MRKYKGGRGLAALASGGKIFRLERGRGSPAWRAGAGIFACGATGACRLGKRGQAFSPCKMERLAAFRRRKTAGKTRPSSWGRRMTKRALGPFWKTRGTRCASRDTNCFECAKSTSSADLVRYAGKSSPARCMILTREPGFPYLPGKTGGFHEKIT